MSAKLIVRLYDKPSMKHLKNTLQSSNRQVRPATENTAKLSGINAGAFAEFLTRAKLIVDQVREIIPIVRRRHLALIDSQPSFQVLANPIGRRFRQQTGAHKF